jgi:DNA-directed RNA polymerase sigma subunit (sigma70/sigma32)
MSAQDDDTELDALAAHVRTHPELTAAAADTLIAAARQGDGRARESLVEHSLGAVLAQAVAHRDRGVEVIDLFQEGSVAAVVAIEEYVARGGSGARLGAYVSRVVGAHLDLVVQREEAAAAEAAALVEDSRLLEVAQVALRRQIGHDPTATELAAVLLWPPERVELIAGMLDSAREQFDAEIVQYLDDMDLDGTELDGAE